MEIVQHIIRRENLSNSSKSRKHAIPQLTLERERSDVTTSQIRLSVTVYIMLVWLTFFLCRFRSTEFGQVRICAWTKTPFVTLVYRYTCRKILLFSFLSHRGDFRVSPSSSWDKTDVYIRIHTSTGLKFAFRDMTHNPVLLRVENTNLKNCQTPRNPSHYVWRNKICLYICIVADIHTYIYNRCLYACGIYPLLK